MCIYITSREVMGGRTVGIGVNLKERKGLRSLPRCVALLGVGGLFRSDTVSLCYTSNFIEKCVS